MAKNNLGPIFSSWIKLIWSSIWCPVGASGIGLMKETRRPVAFAFLLLMCIYFVLELYLFFLVDNIPEGVHLPVTTNSTGSLCHASPYCVITTKGLFLGAVDFYIQKPLSILANEALNIDSIVSANFVSFVHIIAALISAKLIANDSLLVRRIGVMVYEFRNFLDCLDGVVAKEEYKRRGELELFSQPAGFWGYFIDGVSDGFGCIFLLTACFVFMQRHPYQRKVQQKVYTQLTAVSVSTGPLPKTNGKKNDKDSDPEGHAAQLNSGYPSSPFVRNSLSSIFRIHATGLPAFFFLCQLFVSSLFWNRNIFLYGRLLEPTSPATPVAAIELDFVASNLIHSPYMWLVIFSWRICNPLFLTELLLFAIFMDKMHEFLYLFQYSGFFIISCVSAMSEVHRWTAIHRHAKNN